NGGAMASDSCGDVTWSNDFDALSDLCGATGSATVTFTATDDCGNTSETSATFTIEDTTDPTIDTEAMDETVECDGEGNTAALNAWLANNGGAMASDSCGDVTWSNDFDALSDLCGATGSATVTFTATDDCGNTSETSATFTIEDTTDPTIDTEAMDETVECDGEGNMAALNAWLANNGGAMASDSCGDVTWSNDFDALSDLCGATGSATVIFTATDDCGNTSETSATFTIEDTTDPTIDTAAMDETVECDGEGNMEALQAWLDNNGGAMASDSCGDVTWSNDFDALSDLCGATGSATVIFTATDDCGNTSETSATFTIEDTTDPTIDTEAMDETVECDGEGNMEALQAWLDNNGGAMASDSCGDVTWSNDFDALSDLCGATGSATVTFTATDDCGNTSETSATFTIEDTVAPEIHLGDYPEFVCEEDVPASLMATYTDECSGEGDIYATPVLVGEDECSMTYEYTFTATDDCGNSAEEVVTIVREIELVGNCETIFGYDPDAGTCFSEYDFNRWGWTNHLTSEGSYTLDLYAGAGQCDISKGAFTGTATVNYQDGYVTVEYNLSDNYVLNEAHVYIGCDPVPTMKNGKETVAPGQYPFNPDLGGGVRNYTVGPVEVTGDDVYVIVHGVACEVLCECTDGGSIIDGNDGGQSFNGESYDCNEAEEETASSGNSGKNNRNALSSDFTPYPVPFRETLNIQYEFDYVSNVTIQIYDMKGQLLRTYKDKKVTRGDTTQLDIDFAMKANQVYIVRVNTGKEVFSKNVMSGNR
ncbi:T9SS type A sorting domain-containing protein, partial [Salegentibacter chungangensis]